MRLWLSMVGLAFLGCSGDDEPPTEASCDILQTSPLGEVAVEDWPVGMNTVKDDVEALTGTYMATDSCLGKEVEVAITSITQEEIGIVTTPYLVDSPCGCTQDPNDPPDADLQQIGFIDRMAVTVSEFDDTFVPGFEFSLEGAMFSLDEAFIVRGCGTQNIDPVAASDYREVDVILQLSNTRELNLEFVLDPLAGGAPVSCVLSNFSALQ